MDAGTIDVQRDENHTYKVAGIVRPGATELLKNAGLLRGIEYVDEQALWRGKVVHEICRLINKRTINWDSVEPDMRPFGEAYKQFIDDTGFSAAMFEMMLYHPVFNFCGQFDAVGTVRVGSEWWLIDYKSSLTSRGIGKWVGYQLALYQILLTFYFPMMKNIRRFGLKLMGTGRYNLVPFAEANDFAVALSSINVKNGKV